MQRPDRPDRSAIDRQGRAIVERLGGRWSAGGGLCRCPAHDDRTPSLSVRVGDRRLLFHCFAGCEIRAVLRALGGPNVPGAGGQADISGFVAAPFDAAGRNRAAAGRLWAGSQALAGSLAETYLRNRGLRIGQGLADLRYHPRTPCGSKSQAVFRPAMLAAVRDRGGLVAVHRTFLDRRLARLADMPSPRRALGRLGQGAVRLRLPEAGTLGLAEGIETAIAATLLTGIPCWATLGAGRFAGIALPAGVARLVLFLDNDPGGRRAERLALGALHETAIRVDVRYPRDPGADWNDVLAGGSPSQDGVCRMRR